MRNVAMLLQPKTLLRASVNRVRKLAGAEPLDEDASLRSAARQAGQIVVIFAVMLTVLIGLVGIAIDTTYAWREALQVQRAADSAALAGVVYMPGDYTTAKSIAQNAATKNGFADGGINTVNPTSTVDPRELDVTITTQVPTFFIRIFGINAFAESRTGKAVYVMPVAMGSPLAYYGVGCFILQSGTPPPCNGTGTGASGLSASGLATGPSWTGSLGSLGAWGAIITKGGNQQNGDAYAPANDGGSPFSGSNDNYRPSGYYYTVALPSGGGIKIFDPGFCAMGTNSSGSGNYGAGDHWIGSSGTGYPVSTYYTLWDTHNQPINTAAWTIVGGTYTGSTFENSAGYDSANGSNPGSATANAGGCTVANGHDTWWSWPGAQGLGSGTYEVQVQTTNPNNASINQNTSAENMFALEASGTGATVYGQSNMCVYNNLQWTSGTSYQQFYLGKVDRATGAGKTIEIDLFDVGDITAGGTLSVLSPNGSGGTQTTATFSFTTDSNWGVAAGGGGIGPQSGTNVTSIATHSSSQSSNYNNTWIRILIPLPTSYGLGGLWQGGWWQIQYALTGGGGNDTTTWAVNVLGNPVHLVN
jgi:hypothetical protein